MQSKHLNVSHVLMAADPTAPHWHSAITLAEALAEHGVRTTLGCLTAPSPTAREAAAKVADLDLRCGPETDSIEWVLFLEMLAEPDIIQLFAPEHALMPWRSPTVLRVSDEALAKPNRQLFDATSNVNLVIVEDEARFDRLQAFVGAGPFIAVLPGGANSGWNHFLAYEEIVQAARLDLGESKGRFELI
jgi:hypothetical protein